MSTAYLYIAENIVGKFDQGSVGKEGESRLNHRISSPL